MAQEIEVKLDWKACVCNGWPLYKKEKNIVRSKCISYSFDPHTVEANNLIEIQILYTTILL
jgi:hypothetical protein